MEEYKDNFVEYPLNVEKDLLMACFSVFLSGSDCYLNRMQLRNRLLAHFKKCLESEKPWIHNCIRSFVNRLHFVQKTPKSAEIFFVESEAKFKYEGLKFIQDNSQESYISDKYTFAYIVSDIFKVHVNFINDTVVSNNPFDASQYTIYIADSFKLMVHAEKIHRINYKPSQGLLLSKNEISKSKYELRKCKDDTCFVVGHFVPPNIKGYKVHTLLFEDFEKDCVYTIIGGERKQTLYIFDNYDCISSVKRIINPYFYITNGFLQCVECEGLEEAERAARYETF